MHRLLLSAVLLLGSGWAMAVAPTVECRGCVSLRDFGNFGAAQLYRATGTMSASVGNDRIWVVNPDSGRSAFVDLDTPLFSTSLFGVPMWVPDYTQMEINATWIDGSESASWTLPNEVIAAMGESIEVAEDHESPEVTPAELSELPGFDEAYIWQFIGTSGSLFPTALYYNVWSFSVFYDSTTPIVTVIECAWTSAC